MTRGVHQPRLVVSMALLCAAWCWLGVVTRAHTQSPPLSAPGAEAAPPSIEASPFQAEFGFNLLTVSPFGGGPLGDYGYGLGFLFGVAWKGLPLTLGANFLYARWGSSTREFGFDVGDQVVRAALRRTDQTGFFDVWLRLQPSAWWLRPYLEGVIGVKTLSSNYTLVVDGGIGATEDQSRSTLVGSAGFGAGLELFATGNDQGARLYVTLAFRWLHGGRAAFPGASMNTTLRGQRAEVETTTTMITLGISVTADIFGQSESDRMGLAPR